ncbi:ty3-gypsy retrotransposon protein [Cucumis melo var. makuwa]|uniref:Ty3-gypsy retrotransposon protein n=1 Tax=Cucumis melo var. makuwa TaxID=1194695 RepID=A0A5A7UAU9_CUCMM|nr:ty3-gypsy retrotransposon protein [Cucumis melo var. makuwa]
MPASNLSDKESHLEVVSVMMADVTAKAAMAEMKRKVNFLMKVVKERDHEQLQDMIVNSIRAQYGRPPQTSFMYSKSYTKRIDNLRMPLGYQPPKFQQFNGNGNPKQHIVHFVETCENAGSRGDQLVRQFIRSLKGNAFEWYTDLEPEACRQHDGVNKYQTAKVIAIHGLHKPMESSKLGLQRQAHRTICSRDVHPSHPVEKFFVLKELILKLARENKIEMDIDEVAQTNHVAVNMTSSVPLSILLYDQRESLIQFGTFKPILVRFQQKIMTSNFQNKEEPIEDGRRMDSSGSSKRETNEFHSNEVSLPSKAFKRKHLS